MTKEDAKEIVALFGYKSSNIITIDDNYFIFRKDKNLFLIVTDEDNAEIYDLTDSSHTDIVSAGNILLKMVNKASETTEIPLFTIAYDSSSGKAWIEETEDESHHYGQQPPRLISRAYNGRTGRGLIRIGAEIFPQQERTQGEAQHIVRNSREAPLQHFVKQPHIRKGCRPAAFGAGCHMGISWIFSVTPQVEARHSDSPCRHILREIFIAAHMLCHAMGDLQNIAHLTLRQPKHRGKPHTAKAFQFKKFCFHSAHLLDLVLF